MRVRVPVLVVTAYVLLGSAWLVGNPPGASPDETAHYLKAVAAGRGELHLGSAPPTPADVDTLTVQQRWHLTTSRLVTLPGRLDPSGLPCTAFHPELSAACLRHQTPAPAGLVERPTIVGPYQPFTYVVPGLLMRLADDPQEATRLGRVGFWMFSVVFLALAAFLVWSDEHPALSLIGLLVAVTPGVLFMGSSLSANGLEISAGLCFMATIVRLARDGGSSALAWVAGGVSGVVLPIARVTGLLWVVLGVLVLVALVGRRPAWATVRRGGRRAAFAVAAVAAGMATGLIWEAVVQPRPDRSLGAAVRGLPGEFRELPDIFDQAIGVFGWLDTALPRPAYVVWKLLLLALLVLALVVSGRRHRLVLAVLAIGSVLVTLGVATLNRPTGFGAQARYVLPFVVVVPLLAGELVASSRALPAAVSRWFPGVVVGAVAVVHATAWYSNARRYAVGVPGPLFFLGRSEWEPPLGWVPWMVVVGLGVGALVLAGLASARSRAGPAGPATLATTGPSTASTST